MDGSGSSESNQRSSVENSLVAKENAPEVANEVLLAAAVVVGIEVGGRVSTGFGSSVLAGAGVLSWKGKG